MFETICVGVHNERAYPSTFFFRISKNDNGVRDATIGDQVFDAVEHVCVTLATVGGFKFEWIGTRVWFGKAEGQD